MKEISHSASVASMVTVVPTGRKGPSDIRHFNQEQLARRWNLSPRSLERWRWRRQGPPYLKIGGRVVYRLEDIETYEQRNVHRIGPAEASLGSAGR